MRDGAVLLADHYAPADGSTPPTLLIRNLYGWDLPIRFLYGRLYAERGYQVLVQRCRGTFGSGGELDPWVREAEDGRDTAAWMARQDWFSGEFATIGASYLGFVQWALMETPPPGMRGSVVQMGPHAYAPVAWPGGAFALDTMAGWASMLSHPEHGSIRNFLRQLWERRRLRRIAFRGLPLPEACERALGRSYPHLDDWLRHEGTTPTGRPRTGAPRSARTTGCRCCSRATGTTSSWRRPCSSTPCCGRAAEHPDSPSGRGPTRASPSGGRPS